VEECDGVLGILLAPQKVRSVSAPVDRIVVEESFAAAALPLILNLAPFP
jgi:hypothetical protein